MSEHFSTSSEREPAVPDAPPPPFRMVEDAAALAALMRAAEAVETIALDTEADSLHHYREKVCLVQITADGGHWIVDPLVEGLDLTPLARLLEERSLILHGADYDLRLLRRAWGFRPKRIFDTMLAAQILGWREIGLAALVERICGISLSKHGQRADWSVRPIPANLLAYAVEDTRHLHRVEASLKADLAEMGRLGWIEESCERQLEITRLDDPEPAPETVEVAWRIKGGRHLKGRPAAMLRELWQWRDAIAQRLDRPPFRVAANALLLEWANWLIEHPGADREHMPELPAWLRGGRREAFERAVERVLAMNSAEFPPPPERNHRGTRFMPEEEARLKSLLQARDAIAAELEIHPGVLGPREALLKLVRARPETAEALRELSGLMRWQSECLGPVLIPRLAAELPIVEPDRNSQEAGEAEPASDAD